ncbi:MAG: hypothetical protein NC191_01520 [Muribaculaceae bacterium]|nr:hypothetical protein [Muribaculaceae bacterium]
MKKFIMTFFITLCMGIAPAFTIPEEITEIEPPQIEQAEQTATINASVTFDWLDISQAQRNEAIQKYKELLFEKNSAKIYFDKDEFKTKFKPFMKDKNFKHHYFYTNNGITEDEEAKYSAFYYKNNTLLIYAIQYKNNPRQAFYYSAFGKMYYTDVMSDEYPNFPYTSMQYNRKGELSSGIYFVSKDLQYMYDANQEFQGIWYKDKMYNKNGKQKFTRTNW